MSTLAMPTAAASSLPSVSATISSTPSSTYTQDPILALRPPLATSMPVQVLLIGVVLTLMGVLLGHLIFTAQYHWPLARTNFILQVASVVTLIVSQVALMLVVFHDTQERSSDWPYMFDYVAIDVPPFNYKKTRDSWTLPEIAAWQCMSAVTAAMVQVTHIQFLTLLYPSRLERYLIMAILGPLTVASACMEFIIVDTSAPESRIDVADVVNNVSDATLSLIFMAALFLWGMVVNRKQAWRFDGGTAAFGVGSCLLAFFSTVVEFVYIPKRDQYAWMPNLVLAIFCWQNFLGWWWWVGAAGAGLPAEELVKKQEKRRRKKETRANRRQQRSDTAREWWQTLTSIFERPSSPTRSSDSQAAIEMDSTTVGRASAHDHQSPSASSSSIQTRRRVAPTDLGSETTGTSICSTQPFYIRWFYLLRQAHRHAARRQAVEHNSRVAQAYGPAAAEGEAPMGWGLGSYGARELATRREEQEAGIHSGYVSLDRTSEEGPTARKILETTPSGVWWWGPFRRWRLQDATSY